MSIEVIETDDWSKMYWAFNCPLQMWPEEDGHRVLNYMPRKERCEMLDELVTKDELPVFCENAANMLRNLANLFEALGRGEIDTIYYHDGTVEEAKEKK